MSPKNRTKNVNWPKYVTVSNGRIVYRPRIPVCDLGKISTDKYNYLKPKSINIAISVRVLPKS